MALTAAQKKQAEAARNRVKNNEAATPSQTQAVYNAPSIYANSKLTPEQQLLAQAAREKVRAQTDYSGRVAQKSAPFTAPQNQASAGVMVGADAPEGYNDRLKYDIRLTEQQMNAGNDYLKNVNDITERMNRISSKPQEQLTQGDVNWYNSALDWYQNGGQDEVNAALASLDEQAAKRKRLGLSETAQEINAHALDSYRQDIADEKARQARIEAAYAGYTGPAAGESWDEYYAAIRGRNELMSNVQKRVANAEAAYQQAAQEMTPLVTEMEFDQTPLLKAQFGSYENYLQGNAAEDSTAYVAAQSDRIAELEKRSSDLEKAINATGTGVSTAEFTAQKRSLIQQKEAVDAELERLRTSYFSTSNALAWRNIGNDQQMRNLISDYQVSGRFADMIKFILADPYSAESKRYQQYIASYWGVSLPDNATPQERDNYINQLQQLQGEIEAQNALQEAELKKAGYNPRQMLAYQQKQAAQRQARLRQPQYERMAEAHPVASSIGTAVLSPFQGVDFLRYAANTLNNKANVEGYIPTGSEDMEFTNYITAVRNSVSKKLAEKTNWKIFGQNVAAFLYQTGMSRIDSLVNMGVGGAFLGGKGLTNLIMGMSAAANKAKDIADNGGSNRQAFLGGLASGFAEAFFEEFSIEQLLKAKNITDVKELIKTFAAQAGVEASEEIFTEIANIISDAIILRDQSDAAQRIAAYKNMGEDDEHAKLHSFLDDIQQVALAGAGGLLAGIGAGGTAAAGNYASNINTGRNVGSYDVQRAIDIGLALDKDSADYRLAERLQEKLAEGKELTEGERGGLYRILLDEQAQQAYKEYEGKQRRSMGGYVYEQRNDTMSVSQTQDEQNISAVLRGNGMDAETAETVSRAVAAANNGQALTEEQSDAVNGNAIAKGLFASMTGMTLNEDGTTTRKSNVSLKTQRSSGKIRMSLEQRVQNRGELLEAAARQFGEAGLQSVADNFTADSDVSAADFFDAFSAYYIAGHGNVGISNTKLGGDLRGVLTEAQQKAAYEAGRSDAQTALANNKETAGKAKSAGENSGIHQDHYSAAVKQWGLETAQKVDAWARALSVSVTLAEQVEGGAANAQIRGTGVSVQEDSRGFVIPYAVKDPVAFVLGHEFTHRMQDVAPEAYRQFVEAVSPLIQDNVQGIVDIYTKAGQSINYSRALDEAVADYAGKLIADNDLLDRFIEEHKDNRTLLQKIRDVFRAILDKLTGKNRQTEEARQLQNAIDKLEAAYKAATERVKALPTGETADVVRQSIKNGGSSDGSEVSRRNWEQEAGRSGLEIDYQGNVGRSYNRRGTRGQSAGNHSTQKVRFSSLTDYQKNRLTDILYPVVDNNEDWRGAIRGIPVIDIVQRLYDGILDNTPLIQTLNRQVPGFTEAAKEALAFTTRKTSQTEGASTGSTQAKANSGSVDSDGTSLSNGQVEFFKDSTIRDDDGNLLALYHGSRTMAYTVPDLYEGMWLTPDRRYAEVYAEDWHSWRDDDPDYGQRPREDLNGLEREVYDDPDLRVYKVYANGTNGLNLGEIDTPLSEGFVRTIARKMGVRYSEVNSIAQDYMEENTYMFTRSHEFIELAKARGFDYLQATEKGRDTYCIINAEQQVKLASNKAPTENVDMRFSLKAPVEETGTLVALHNLSADKLNKALALGGFPMPSIAVTRSDIPHTNFGDITLVMDKSTVDPQASRRNTVYSADAWTPTFPQIEYEPDPNVQDKIENKYYDLYRKYGADAVRPLYKYGNDLENTLNYNGGVDGIFEQERDNVDMMKVFLLDQGLDIPGPVMEETVSRLNDATIEYYDSIIAALGEDAVREITAGEGSPIQRRKAWFEKYGDILKDVYREYFRRDGMTESEIENAVEQESVAAYTQTVRKALTYLENGPETRSTSVNTEASENAIREAVDQKAYEAWLHDLFDGVVKSSGIYNGRNIYTSSGNRRSFSATHYAVTLDNIAKAMAAQNGGNSRNVSGFYGVKSLRAGMAERFDSIKAMHDREGRLRHLTQEEADEINDALGNRLSDVMQRIYDTGIHGKYDNVFIDMDAIGNMLMEITEKQPVSIDSIVKYFKDTMYHVGNEIASDIRTLLFDISEMPVNIFEAKPERAVRFDEVLAAVVPQGTDAALLDKLRDQGVQSILEYTKGDDADRLNKVNSVEGARFSLKARDADYMAAVESGEDWKVERMVRDAATAWGAAQNDNGRPLDLYHGTPRFGFTRFDNGTVGDTAGLIYTSTRREVAANYAGRDHYAGTRPIGKKFIENATRIKDIIQNAKTVYESNYSVMTDKQKAERMQEIEMAASEIAERFNALPDHSKLFQWDDDDYTFNNALSMVEDPFFLIQGRNYEGYTDEEIYGYLASDLERFEQNLETVRNYLSEHRKEILDAGMKEAYQLFTGYDLFDAYVDISHTYMKLLSGKEVIVNEGGNVNYPGELQEAMDAVHNIGAYHLYGNLGARPLIIDAEQRDWLTIKAPEVMGDDKWHSTDWIAQTARAKGYTSVVIKNVYDGGIMGDDYIFFGSDQVKSADPVTYDDAGNVIPLSERFNRENEDIRYSLKDNTATVYNRTAVLNESTVDKYLKDYAAPSSPKYAQAYIAYMSPAEYLALTTSRSGRAIIEAQTEPLDTARLADVSLYQPMQLRIDHETGDVEGHEGRHRMNALLRAGVQRVPVLLFDSSNKNSKTAMDSLVLHGQDFGSTRSYAEVTVRNIQPLSYGNRDTVIGEFAAQPTNERVAERYGRETVRYSLKPFRQQINDVLDNNTSAETTHLYAGKTPALYGEFGLDTDIPVLITARHIRNMNATTDTGNGNVHSLSRGKIARIPEAIANPVMVMVSNTDPNRLVVVTDILDKENRPVIVALEPDGTGNYMNAEIDANIIVSGYGRNGFDSFLKTAFSDGRMLMVDYDKSRQLQQTPGVQFPNNLPRGDFTDNIARYAAGVKSRRAVRDAQRTESRSSLKSSMEGREIVQLRRQVERLQEQVDYWKGQTKRTDRAAIDSKAVERTLKDLAREYTAKLTTEETAALTAKLQSLYDYISHGGEGRDELTFTDAYARAYDIANALIENAVAVDDQLKQTYSDLLSYIKAQRFVIAARDSHDIADFNEWRKTLKGKMKVTMGEKGNIDTIYSEMAQRWPEWFDAEGAMHPADQLMTILDTLEMLSAVEEYNPFDANMEDAKTFAANEIMERFFDVPQVAKTFADRQAEKAAETKAKGAQRLQAERERGRERVQAVREQGRERVAALREQKNEQIAKLRRANAEHVKERVAAVRAQKNDQINRILEHNRQMRENASARRSDSEARSRLLRIIRRLQNKKMPAVNRARLQEIIGDIDTIAKGMTGKTIEKLSDLREWYDDRRKNDPDFIADPRIEDAIARLSKRHISELSAQEVADLTEVLLNIENELRTEHQLIDEQDRRDTFQQGEQIINDVYATRGSKGGFWDTNIVTETLSPTREIRRLTGYVDNDPLYRAVQSLQQGELKMLDYQRRAGEAFLKFANDKAFSKFFSGKEAEGIKIAGLGPKGPVTVTITPAMRTALYLHSLNDQNLRHIRDGGITVPDFKLYQQGKISEAYDRGTTIRLTPSQVRSITAKMTAKERAFAQAAHNYFNGQSRSEINETSEKLKGYSVAGVEHYFPINTDRNFSKTDFESIKYDGSIEGMGFLKERVNAANPIYLRDANDVLSRSIQQHSQYVGMAIPVRNFNKLLGVNKLSFNEDGSRNGYDSSVQQAIRKQWGSSGYDYIEQLMSDIQNGHSKVDSWDSLFRKLRGSYAKAVLTLNASVALKQAASYPTAAAVLGWEPLVKAMKDFGKVDLDLIAKYTPLQWYRSQGFSSKELGDLKKNDRQLPEVLNWVQGVDLLTTRKLWKASEYYVRQHNKSLNVGSDAYYKAVAEIYNKVILDTQPNYTTMERPQMLRSNNSLIQNLAMFKTQPFQNFNILYDAAANLEAKKRQGDAAAIKEARRGFTNAVTSQLAQLAVFASMTMLWSMFRGKGDKYKDEEKDEYTLSSVLKALGKDMVGGLFSGVPFGSDVWELASSKLFGDKYYGLDVVSVSALADTVSSVEGLTSLFSDTFKTVIAGEDVDWNNVRIKADGYFKDLSKTLGVPYENVVNLFNAVYRNAQIKANGPYVGGYQTLKLTTDPSSGKAKYMDVLYGAYANNREAFQTIYDDMIAEGLYGEDAIKSAMETRMKKAQGVEHVSDLSTPYLPAPETRVRWDNITDALEAAPLWNKATKEQQDAVNNLVYQLISGSGSGDDMQAKIDHGASVGLDDTEYIMFRLALDMADQEKHGSVTNDEYIAALDMLTELSSDEKGYLWSITHTSDKNNPYSSSKATTAAHEYKDEKAAAKEEKSKADIANVTDSSAISAASYDPVTGIATVTWKSSGKTYTYPVSQVEWDAFKNAVCKGKFINQNWKQ